MIVHYGNQHQIQNKSTLNCESPLGLYRSLYTVYRESCRERERKVAQKGGNHFFTFLLLIAPPYPQQRLWVEICSTHDSHLSASWLQSLRIRKPCSPFTPPAPPVPGCVFHGAFLWDCLSLPKGQAGLFAIWQQGDHFLHWSEKQSPSTSLHCLKAGGRGLVCVLPSFLR